ncbi:MAG: LamB/YcsF family protein [Verrucomicrobiales bacterium]|nr:LamB/YcsF family protein [Verrucomicrobiales bacterium]
MSPGPRPNPDPVLLNCDLGEGEPLARTQDLLSLIDAANIACGGHAGTDASMRNTLAMARNQKVLVGAHPGLSQGFGRDPATKPTARELQDLVTQQIHRLARHALDLGIALSHVKLHGALYHFVDADPPLAEAYLDTIQRSFSHLVVIARADGACAAQARRRRLAVWDEAFLDRGYHADGTLVPRGQPGDLLADTRALEHRLGLLRDRGGWTAIDDTWLPIQPSTLCVHGDSPRALEFLKIARQFFPRPINTPPA